ncbi:MAG: RNA polymerase sigma factor [Clostridia bacterium]|nr:RNA polymerase sigma factor [Clostridia bacterium]
MLESLDLEQIYNTYSGKIMAYIRARITNYAVAEDLCQDVFEKVTRMLPSFDSSRASLTTWIYTIARNRVIDYYRTSHPASELPEDMPLDSEIDDHLLQEDSLRELASALGKLPQELRDIIILRYSSNIPLTEIAQRMNLSYGAVKLRHQKALELLRNALSD